MIALEEQLILIIFMGEKGEKRVRYRDGGDDANSTFIIPNKMTLIETIPYYLVQVRFQDNEIQIYDMISKKVVASEPCNQKIVAFRKVESQLYLALNEKDEIVSEISISIKLISKKSELHTEAGYILDFHMLSQSHGFYFGYYEIGEFKLTKDAKLVKVRSYLVHNCTRGRVNKSKYVYLGCREKDKDFLVKLSWKSNRDPKVLWKKAIPSAVMVMEIIGDRLFIGLKNGLLQLWDIQKDECIENTKLFSSTFSVSTIKGENITLASKNGDVARISKNGKIQWKTKITREEIVGIYEDEDYILIINTVGEQFHIKYKSGKLIKHRYNNLKLGGNAGLSSSIIKYRERFVITGYGGIWTFRHRNFDNSMHQYMGDPLMRIIHQHPFGFYSGDDNESVCFWGLGDIKIEVKNYKPPLKKYKKLKLKSLGRPKRKKKRALKLMKTAQLRIEKLETSRSGKSGKVRSENHKESLDELLKKILGAIPGVKSDWIPEIKTDVNVSVEGDSIETSLPNGTSKERIAAMTGALLSLSKRVLIEMEEGDFEHLHINGSKGYLLVIQNGPNITLRVSKKSDDRDDPDDNQYNKHDENSGMGAGLVNL